MAFAGAASIRMTAIAASLKGFPIALKRPAKARNLGLNRMAPAAAISRQERTAPRPAKMGRGPLLFRCRGQKAPGRAEPLYGAIGLQHRR
jgi:hypothetical protein